MGLDWNALAAMATLVLGAGPAGAQVAPAPDPVPVVFTVDRVESSRGRKAILVVSVRTEVPLRSISMALDFDESRVRVLEVRRLAALSADGTNPTVPDDLASTSVSNTDLDFGNQVREGWVYIELSAVSPLKELLVKPGVDVPLLEVEFLVLRDAAPGFTPVEFAPVGPVKEVPSTFFINRAEEADARAVPGAALPLDLRSGGINIIGEVGFFMRGDSNFDRRRDIADPIVSLSFLFTGGTPLACFDSADANDDGSLDITDAIYTLHRLFESPVPFPEPELWGIDPTPDGLGCAVYPGR